MLACLNSAYGSNTVHRHEPPVTNDPVLVLHIDKEKEFVVVSKPGSMVSTQLFPTVKLTISPFTPPADTSSTPSSSC